ncbi:MAG: hypothetical protein V4539_24755 [Bacteroidota bacterium]
MRKILPILLLLTILWSCKDKKVDLSGETPIKVTDFIAAFPKLTPPFIAADTNITKVDDTTTIGYKAMLQFFPDSSLTPIIGNSKKVTIHPVGIIEKDKESYLLANMITSKKATHLAVFVIDKKNKYLGSKELLNTSHDDEYLHSVSVNREPTFLISKEKIGKEGSVQYSRTGWVYSVSSGIFMVVINDSNEDPQKTSVINPLDTFPRKNKFSGDYVQNKKNYISIRDTKKPNVYQFFIHFDKDEGSCSGELKGEFAMKDANTAIFSQKGDPCVIDFRFDGNEITVKEQGSCGNHRGMKCFFDDTFVKKREPRAVKKK